MKSIFTLIVIIFIPSFVAAENISELQKLFVGTYYQVSMNSNVTITLDSDLTYKAEYSACVGEMGKSSGTWSLSAPSKIEFNQVSGSGTWEKGFESMHIIETKDESNNLISLVPVSDLKDHIESIAEYDFSVYTYTKDRIERLELF